MTTELTPYEQAVKEAERLSEIARNAYRQVGKYTPRINKLCDEADKAWVKVEKMLGKKQS